MDELKGIVEDMWDEVEGAEHYAGKAAHAKGIDSARMNTYADMARQELSHFDALHKVGIKWAQEHPDHTEAKTIWNWELDKLLHRAAKVRNMLEWLK